MDPLMTFSLVASVSALVIVVLSFTPAFRHGGNGGEVAKYYKLENDQLREQNNALKLEKETFRGEVETLKREVGELKKDNAQLKAENADLRGRVEFLFEKVTGRDISQKTPPVSASPRRAVLFVSTSPIQGAILQTGVEARAIEDALRKSGYEFKAIQAARPHDITHAILDFKPTILHFSGHGADGDIFLEDEMQRPKPVTLDAIARLLRAMPVVGIILNACFSAKNLSPLMAVSQWAVAMKRAVADPTAIAFSDGLYLALADGKDIQSSFDIGVASAGMQSAGQMDIPVLEVRR